MYTYRYNVKTAGIPQTDIARGILEEALPLTDGLGLIGGIFA